MGTRGAIGYRINEKDKLTYNNHSSHPKELGKDIIEYIKLNYASLKQIAKKIKILTTSTKHKLATDFDNFEKAHIENIALENWNHYPIDSSFCEYAYIINIDTQKLEFYKGLNNNPNAPGRYAKFRESNFFNKKLLKLYGESTSYGVALALEIPLKEIIETPTDKIIEQMEILSKLLKNG